MDSIATHSFLKFLRGILLFSALLPSGCTSGVEAPADCFLRQVQQGMSSDTAKQVRRACEERYEKSAVLLTRDELSKLSASAEVKLTRAELRIQNSNDSLDVTEVVLSIPGGLPDGVRVKIGLEPRGEIYVNAEIDGGKAKRHFDSVRKTEWNIEGVGRVLMPDIKADESVTKADGQRALLEVWPEKIPAEKPEVVITSAWGVRRR